MNKGTAEKKIKQKRPCIEFLFMRHKRTNPIHILKDANPSEQTELENSYNNKKNTKKQLRNTC